MTSILGKNVGDLTLNELACLSVRGLQSSTQPEQSTNCCAPIDGLRSAPLTADDTIDHGLCIVVLDRGWVYIGHVVQRGGMIVGTGPQCANIRRWGTDTGDVRGLGKLASDGKQSGTLLDRVPKFIAPLSALITLIPCNEEKWT